MRLMEPGKKKICLHLSQYIIFDVLPSRLICTWGDLYSAVHITLQPECSNANVLSNFL